MTEIAIRDVTPLLDGMTEILRSRASAAQESGNATLAKKWEREIAALTQPKIVDALNGIGFDHTKLEKLAIYAAQKLRRIVAQHVGTGRVDPFTLEIVKNARASEGVISGRAARGSLSTKVTLTEGMVLAGRRVASEGTASSQAGSTRQALAALNAATISRDGRESVTLIDLEHPMLATVGV